MSRRCCISNSEAKKGTFSTSFTPERSRCASLLGCGHLGDSELNECTVLYYTEPPYKSAEAPRFQEVVVLATLKQKKAGFLLFHTRKVRVCDFAGLWAPERLGADRMQHNLLLAGSFNGHNNGFALPGVPT